MRHLLAPSLALFLALAVSLLLPSCGPSSTDQNTLSIISPHASDIRREFQTAFSQWHLQKYGAAVHIEWLDVGGTANVIKTIQSGGSAGIDIAFGGGSAAFNDFIDKKVLQPLPDSLQPALDRVPPKIFSVPLHDPAGFWIAATMSNFGIVYNKQRVAELKLPPPKRWEDLAAASWIGNLSLADPSKSHSVGTSYEMILQQYGWEKGWAILTRLFANAFTVREGGANPSDDVANAEAIAGIVIDFYGRKYIARAGPDIVDFIVPEGGSSLDADPIAILKGAKRPDLAAHFIEFVISPQGQRLWTFRAGTPGGPVKNTLGRLSILSSLYESESQFMTDPRSPFLSDTLIKNFNPVAQRTRGGFLGDLIKSALIDNQPELAAARRAVHDAGDPPDLLAQFDALPTYAPAAVDPAGQLTAAPPRPITTDELPAVSAQFNPSADKDKARFPYMELLQTDMKKHWQSEFAARMAALQQSAKSRQK